MNFEILNGAQRKIVREAILSGYSDPADFDLMLGDELNRSPLQVFAGGQNFAQRLAYLVRLMQDEGWTDDFVAALQRSRPRNAVIQALPDTLRMAGAVIPDRVGRALGNGQGAGASLERIVSGGGIDGFLTWTKRMSVVGEATCRIERPAGTPAGTGILVGDGLVLTNYHVIESCRGHDGKASELVCRFDFAADRDAVSVGREVRVAQGADWLIAESPYDENADLRAVGVAASDRLDFALLRLEGSAPPLAAGSPRAPLRLDGDAAAVRDGAPVFIVQHPSGSPLALALGVSKGENENGSRFRYDADTLAGSSGSGVFNQRLELVALHHAGDPQSPVRAEYNQGIPVTSIMAMLTSEKITLG